MARGRKPLPDAIKAAKGNPGKRRLADAGVMAEASRPSRIDAPDYLTGEAERSIFSRVVDELDRVRFIKRSDTDTLSRWCVYMGKWVAIKRQLDGDATELVYETVSKHGSMLRAHPLFAAMVQIERLMLRLEDRIGLNPAARQQILRGIIALPTLPPEGLFGETAKDGPAEGDKAPAPPTDDPLGFLNQATKH